MFQIEKVEIRQFEIPLVEPFVTGFGTITRCHVVLVALHDQEGRTGWGEAPVLTMPLYNAEIPESVVAVVSRVIMPIIKERAFVDPETLHHALTLIRGNECAKSAVIMAAYDLHGQQENKRLVDLLGGTERKLIASATISIHSTVDEALRDAEKHYNQGVRHLKLKIKPGYDSAYAQALRKNFTDAVLMLDANSSYTLSEDTIRTFQKCDGLNIACIEQPLQSQDIIDHAKLQKHIQTPIALDESIKSVYDVTHALELGSCRLVNIKVGRVGGLVEALRINGICAQQGISTWVGGMLESPIGFYANLALATVTSAEYPVDFLSALTYMERFEDFFAVKPFALSNGTLEVKITKPGLGLELNWDALNEYKISTITL